MPTEIMKSQLPALPLSSLLPLERLCGMVGSIRHQGEAERYHLPRGVSLTSAERQLAETAKAQLEVQISPTCSITIAGDEVDGEKARHAILTHHLMAKSTSGTEAAASSAKLDEYDDALGDLPAWAIRDALTVWNRGGIDSKLKPNYNFAAPPQILRSVALDKVAMLKRRLAAFDRLLKAEPYEAALQALTEKPRGFAPQLPSPANALRRL